MESGTGEFVVNVVQGLLDCRDPRYSYKLKDTLTYGGRTLGLNFPQTYAAPRVSAGGIDAEVKYLFKWCTALEIPYSSCDESETPTTVVPAFTFATAPTLLPASPQFRAYEHWKYVQIYAADYVEEALRQKGDAAKMRQELAYLQAILEDKAFHPLGALEPLVMVELGYLAEVVKALRSALVASLPNYALRRKHFLEETGRWWESLLWAEAKELTEEAYMPQRRVSSGAFVLFELLALLEDVEIGDDVRGREDFVRYREAAAALLGLTNDLWSVGKKISDGDEKNVLRIKIAQKELSFEAAFEETRRLLNQVTGEVRRLSKRLLDALPGKKGLQNYVRLINLHLDGHHVFFARVIRYGRFSHRHEPITEEEYWDMARSN